MWRAIPVSPYKIRVIFFLVNILKLWTLHKSPLMFDCLFSPCCVCQLLKMKRFSFLAIPFFPSFFFSTPRHLDLFLLCQMSQLHTITFPRFYPKLLGINSCAWLLVFTNSIRVAVKREVENNINLRQIQCILSSCLVTGHRKWYVLLFPTYVVVILAICSSF